MRSSRDTVIKTRNILIISPISIAIRMIKTSGALYDSDGKMIR